MSRTQDTDHDQTTRTTLARIGLVGVILTVGVVAVAVAAVGAVGTATAADPTEEAVVVSLDETGDARLTLTVSFDLTTAEEATSFEQLRSDTERQQALLERYSDRLTNVAATVNAATDREMRVLDPRVDTRTSNTGTVGVVDLTVTWDRLAAVDGTQLRLSRPFDSGFAPDRTVIVEVPDQYRISDTAPTATVESNTAVWDAGQSLAGFTVTAVQTDTTEAADAGDAGPGVGPAVALAAFVVVTIAVLFTRR